MVNAYDDPVEITTTDPERNDPLQNFLEVGILPEANIETDETTFKNRIHEENPSRKTNPTQNECSSMSYEKHAPSKIHKISLSISLGAVYCVHYYLGGACTEVSLAVVFISQLWIQFI